MPRLKSKHDRLAFIACSSTAIALVVAAWVLSVRTVVQSGVAGAKETLTGVAETARDVKEQSSPDPETVAAIKSGLKTIFSADEVQAERRQAVEAVAGMMAEGLSEESEGSEDLDE
jgi:hypothetical protein